VETMGRCSIGIVALVAFVLAPATAGAQHAITASPTTIDFTTYAGLGLQPTALAGQLDSDEWAIAGLNPADIPFGGTCIMAGTDCARGVSTGGVTDGGLYAFTTTAGDPSFGWQPATTPVNDFVSPAGMFTLRFRNDTGASIVDPTISYEVWYRNDGGRGTTVVFAWAVDAGTFTTESGMTVDSPQNGTTGAPWVSTTKQIRLTGTTIAAGGVLQLRWTTTDTGGGSGARDELALDDIRVAFGCGDAFIAGNEACDDGNPTAGDGCDASCVVEHGYACTGSPSTCTSTCGDGVVASDEPCDDGDTAGGDGCSDVCTVELDWSCLGEPSICENTGTCGDGSVTAAEGCDDGNTAADDGCSPTCAAETGWVCTGSPSTCIADRDADTIPDDADNCPDLPNPSQSDADGDGLGNACDSLLDGDGDGGGGCCDSGGGAGGGALVLAGIVALALRRRRMC